MGIAASARFYHTLTKKIGLNKHKLILLVNDNPAECNVFQEKIKLSPMVL